MTDDDAKSFAKALEATEVSILDLSNNKITQQGAINVLQNLRYSKTGVTTIDFDGNPINARGSKVLQEQAESAKINVKLTAQKSVSTKKTKTDPKVKAIIAPQFQLQVKRANTALVVANEPEITDATKLSLKKIM